MSRRWIAGLLAMAMVVSVLLPVSAFAEELTVDSGETIVQENEVADSEPAQEIEEETTQETEEEPAQETEKEPAQETEEETTQETEKEPAQETEEETTQESEEEATQEAEEEATQEAEEEATQETEVKMNLAPRKVALLDGEEDTAAVAQIGDRTFDSLQEAVNAIKGSEETIITLLHDAAGNGVKVPGGKNITFDLNSFTYTIDGETVGSDGTETNGFQLLKGSNITFRNGTLASTKAKILIQNYSNLTLDSVNMDGASMPAGQYALSNNCGTVKIIGSTSITAPKNGVAFDVYYWPNGGYGEGVNVIVDTTGTITGKIEYASDGSSGVAQKATLNIVNGTIEGSLSTKLTETGIKVTGGSFSDNSFAAYCEDGKTLVQDSTGAFVPQYKITVNGEGCGTLAEAISVANAIAGTDPVAISLTEGTFAPSGNEQLCITRPNVTLTGAGADKTTIDCQSFSVSGQAGILAKADNVTIENLKVLSSAGGNVSAVKFSAIGDGNSPLPILNGGTVKNVTVQSTNSHALNIHGVDGMVVDGLTVTGAGKCGISVASSSVQVSNTSISNTGWNSAIGVMYSANNENAYKDPSNVVLGEGNNLTGAIYSERPANAPGGCDTVAVPENNEFVYTANANGSWTITKQDETTAVAQNNNNHLKYADLKSAVEMAQDGDVIVLLGNVKEDVVIPEGKTVTLDLAGNTITNASNHTIVNGGNLTILDSSEDKSGKVDNVTHAKAAVYNQIGATVTMNGGTYTRSNEAGDDKGANGNSWYTLCNFGNMIINGGATVTNTGSFSSMIENGFYGPDVYEEGAIATLTVNGGNLAGGLNTIKNDTAGELYITGGTFENSAQAAVLNWNLTEITGGTFTVKEPGKSCLLNGVSGWEADETSQGKIIVKGGSFTSPDGVDCIANYCTNAAPTVSGGSFSANPSKYLADGYQVSGTPPYVVNQTPAPKPSQAPSASQEEEEDSTPAATPTPVATPVPTATARPATVVSHAKPTATPTATPQIPAGEPVVMSAQVEATVTDSKAVAAVESRMLTDTIKEAVDQAKATDGTPTVKVEVTTTEDATAMEVTLPAQPLETLAQEPGASLTVTSGVAEVTFDTDALTSILDQAEEEIVLVVNPVEKSELTDAQAEKVNGYPTYELLLMSGDTVISTFKGKATVTIPYTLAEGQQAEGIVVWYVADNGDVTVCNTTYDEEAEKVTFETPHFSRYAIAYDASRVPSQPEAAAPTVEEPVQETEAGGISLPLVLVVAVVVIFILFIVARLIFRRKD